MSIVFFGQMTARTLVGSIRASAGTGTATAFHVPPSMRRLSDIAVGSFYSAVGRRQQYINQLERKK